MAEQITSEVVIDFQAIFGGVNNKQDFDRAVYGAFNQVIEAAAQQIKTPQVEIPIDIKLSQPGHYGSGQGKTMADALMNLVKNNIGAIEKELTDAAKRGNFTIDTSKYLQLFNRVFEDAAKQLSAINTSQYDKAAQELADKLHKGQITLAEAIKTNPEAVNALKTRLHSLEEQNKLLTKLQRDLALGYDGIRKVVEESKKGKKGLEAQEDVEAQEIISSQQQALIVPTLERFIKDTQQERKLLQTLLDERVQTKRIRDELRAKNKQDIGTSVLDPVTVKSNNTRRGLRKGDIDYSKIPEGFDYPAALEELSRQKADQNDKLGESRTAKEVSGRQRDIQRINDQMAELRRRQTASRRVTPDARRDYTRSAYQSMLDDKGSFNMEKFSEATDFRAIREELQAQERELSDSLKNRPTPKQAQKINDELLRLREQVLVLANQKSRIKGNSLAKGVEDYTLQGNAFESSALSLLGMDKEALRLASIGDRQTQATTAFEQLTRTRQKAIIKALRGASSNYQSAWNNTPTNEVGARSQHEDSASFIHDLLSAVEARDKTIRQGAEAVDSKTVVQRKEAERLKALYESQVSAPNYDVQEADRVLKKAITTARASTHTARTDSGRAESQALLEQLKRLQTEVEGRFGTIRTQETNARIKEIETYLNKIFDSLVSTNVTSDGQLKQLLGQLKPGAKLGRLTKELASLKGEVGTDSPAMQELDTVRELLKETLQKNKKGQSTQALDTLIKTFNADLAQQAYGTPEFKATVSALRTALSKRFADDQKARRDELAKLSQTVLEAAPTPKAKARELLLTTMQNRGELEQGQVNRLLTRARTQAESVPDTEGLALSSRIARVQGRFDARFNQPTLAELNARIEQGMKNLQGVNTQQALSVYAGDVTRNIRRRYRLDQDEDQRRQALLDVAAQRDRVGKEVKASDSTQKIGALRDIVKQFKDSNDEFAVELVKSSLTSLKLLLKDQIKSEQGSNPNTLDEFKSVVNDLSQYKQQVTGSRLTAQKKSSLYQQGREAAQSAHDEPMHIKAGDRDAAIYYYETLRKENRQKVSEGGLSPAEMQDIGRQTETAIRNISLLRREINGTLGPLHQAKLAITAFFRYAGVYGAGFAAVNAIRDLIGETLNLDKALKSIQAVSQATAKEMTGVEDAIKNTATSTQFSTQQVAEATQVLAQAGVESKDLPKVLDSVARFASATASDLTLAADVLTSLREVFTEFGDSFKDSRLADALTNAVNISKLNVQDLQVITSLGAQTAKSFGVSADQFLAAAATLSNVGIRKSTVGTGLRQAMLEILNPDAQTLAFLKERYAKIGEALSEEAIKSRYQAFQTAQDPMSAAFGELRRIGVSGSARYDFKRVVDIRAENVLLPLMDSLETYQQNIAKIAQSGSAAKGADVQMQAFLNTWGRLSSEVESLSHTLVADAIPPLTKLVDTLADFAEKATEAGDTWKQWRGVFNEDNLRTQVDAEAAKLDAARIPYNKDESGTKANEVKASGASLDTLRTELASLLGEAATRSPDVFKTLQDMATKEQGSTEQDALFKTLETLTQRSFTEAEKRSLQTSSLSLSDIIGKTKGSRTNVIDDAQAAFSGDLPQKDMQRPIQDAYQQIKGNLPTQAPDTLDELATQIEGILSFYDKVFALSEEAARSLEGDKQLVRKTMGSDPLTAKELNNPEATSLKIQQMGNAGDTEGLALLRERLKSTPKVSHTFEKQLALMTSGTWSEIADDQRASLSQQLDEADKAAQQLNQDKSKVKESDANKKAKETFTTQYISKVHSQSGIEDLQKKHDLLKISTEEALTRLQTELEAVKQQADSSGRQIEIEQRQFDLKKTLQVSETDLLQRKLMLTRQVNRTKDNPYKTAAEDIGSEYGLGSLVSAVIGAESNSNTKAVSNKDALGLMQLIPSTAEGVAKQLGIQGYSTDRLTSDPMLNIRLGSKYLKDQITAFSADGENPTEDELKTALAAYNWGPGKVEGAVKTHGTRFEALRPHLPSETRDYVDRVIAALGPSIAGRYADVLRPDDKINHMLKAGMQGSPDSPEFKLSEQYYKTRSDNEASNKKAELEIAQTRRKSESDAMQREINVKQEELKRLEQELNLAGKGVDTQKSTQLAEKLKQANDEIARLRAKKERFDRNASDPAFNRDLDLAYSNQLSANNAQYEAKKRDILREEASKTIRIEGQNKEDLLTNIKQRSTLGDLSGANDAIDKLIQKQELLRKAYREREDATDGITEKEKAQNDAVRKSKDDLEAYTLRVSALTQALTVLDEKLKDKYEKPLEQKAAEAYSQARGFVPTKEMRRETLTREKALDLGRIKGREQALAQAQEQQKTAPEGVQAEYTSKIAGIKKEVESLTVAVEGINAELYKLDVTPLQALGDVSLNNVVEGLNNLEYSAKNLQQTIEGHLVSGIDNAITGLVDFATNGDKARQSAENLRQAIIAVNQAKLDYQAVVLERPRAYSESLQMADSKTAQNRLDLMARGASGEQLAAGQAGERNNHAQMLNQAEAAQRDRENAAARILSQQQKAKNQEESRSGLWGTLKTAAGDMGRSVIDDVIKSTVLGGVKGILGLGDPGTSKQKPMFVEVTNWADSSAGIDPTQSTNADDLSSKVSSGVSKPLDSFSSKLSGLFSSVTDSIQSMGSNLFGGIQSLASAIPGANYLSQGLGSLGNFLGVDKLFSSGFDSFDPGAPDTSSIGTSSEDTFRNNLSRSMSSSGFNRGGMVKGAGTGTSDSIPALLSNGEYVINAKATNAFGVHNLDRINQFKFANGGFVNRSRPPVTSFGSSWTSSRYNSGAQTETPGTVVQVIDQRSNLSPQIETQRSFDSNGKEVIKMIIREEVKAAVSNGVFDSTLRANFGLRRPGVQR